jgi:hypothetical protein
MTEQELKKHVESENEFNKKHLIECFAKDQTLTMLGRLRSFGVGLKVLNNNKWERLCEYKLPFDRFIILYDDDLKITDIGIY